jgi:uncharacterized protein YkwD
MDHAQGSRPRGAFAALLLLREVTVRLLTAALLGSLPVVTPPSTVASTPPERSESPSATDPLVAAVIEAHNRERAMEKKPPLRSNARLEAAARAQARDMAEHDKLSHEGSDGSTPSRRIERQEYHGRRIGENLAEGQETVVEVMRGWMKSPHHRENILGDFDEIGVARASAKDGTSYWCVDFGLSWPRLDPARASAEVVEALNRAREKAKQPALTVNPTLEAAAREQASILARRDRLEPKKEEPSNPLRRIAEGDQFERLGELAASGQATPEAVVRFWLDAQAQRESLLGDFAAIGVGCATAAKGTPYWVAILGRPAR